MTDKQISVPYPVSLAELLKLAEKEFEQEIKNISVVKLLGLSLLLKDTVYYCDATQT